MARMSVPYHIIKLLARWATDTIDRYLKDVPLERLTSAYLEGSRQHQAIPDQVVLSTDESVQAICDLHPAVAASGSSSSSSSAHQVSPYLAAPSVVPKSKGVTKTQVLAMVNDALTPLLAQHEAAKVRVSSLANDLARANESIRILTLRSRMPYICSEGRAGSYHVTMGDYQLLPKRAWVTSCGWKYADSAFVRTPSLPNVPRTRVCAKCVPDTLAVDLGVIMDADT